MLLLGLLSGELDALYMVVVPIERELDGQVLEMLNSKLKWCLTVVCQWVELQWFYLILAIHVLSG